MSYRFGVKYKFLRPFFLGTLATILLLSFFGFTQDVKEIDSTAVFLLDKMGEVIGDLESVSFEANNSADELDANKNIKELTSLINIESDRIVSLLNRMEQIEEKDKISCLVLANTRELAYQITKEYERFSQNLNYKITHVAQFNKLELIKYCYFLLVKLLIVKISLKFPLNFLYTIKIIGCN